MIWSPSPSSSKQHLHKGASTILAAAVLILPASQCWGQGFGPDPFQPYNSQFAPFVYPVSPGPLDYGYNMGTNLGGVRGANQFENYLNLLRGIGGNRTGGGSGAGNPYFRANRAYDREFNRLYRPNREADAKFDTNQETVTETYFKYLREKDPKRRAELFREYNRARNLADRELATPRAAGAFPRISSRSTRGEGRTARPAGETSASERDLLSTPPPATTGSSRDRTASGAAARDSAAGPPPSPGRSADLPRTSRDLSPSRVLQRALRGEPPPLGRRTPRSSTSSAAGPPPPP
jgi:hypothetical protein